MSINHPSLLRSKKDAQKRLTELLHQRDSGNMVEPAKITMGEWLHLWLDTVVRNGKRPRTYTTYRNVIDNHLVPKLGHIRVQQLQAQHIQSYYAGSELASSTLGQHHAVISAALKAATMQGVVPRNVATLVIGKPRLMGSQRDIRDKCWTAAEAQRFLAVTHEAGEQMQCFYHLALDTGARKAELCGLLWSEVDLDRGQVRITQQLISPVSLPVFGPTKGGIPRSITLMSQTIELLRRHKARQAETKLASGRSYSDFGLVFARDAWSADKLGWPLSPSSIGRKGFKALIEKAGVRQIVIHGLRHTSGSLLLMAGVSPYIVQARLGHASLSMTMSVYAHVLPASQQDAATRLSGVIYPTK